MRMTATLLIKFWIVSSRPDRNHIELPTKGDLEADSDMNVDQKSSGGFDCDSKARTGVPVLARAFRLYTGFDCNLDDLKRQSKNGLCFCIHEHIIFSSSH